MATDDDPRLLTVLTTEHFVLQTARGGTISEANGRASIYLAALSAALIALGFTSGTPDAFAAFAAVVLPILVVLGLFTFVRLLQTSVENILYLVRIQRIRHQYAKLLPQLDWIVEGGGGAGVVATGAALATMGMRPGFHQTLFTLATMVAALNSVVLGAGVCLLLLAVWPLSAAVCAGTVSGLLVLAAHLVVQDRRYKAMTPASAPAGRAG